MNSFGGDLKQVFTDILAGFTFNNRVLRPEEGPRLRGRNVVYNNTIAGRRRTLLLLLDLK